jgi:ferritin
MKLYTIPAECVDIFQQRLASEYMMERFYKRCSTWCDLNGYKCASDFFVDMYHIQRQQEHKIEKNLTNWGVAPVLPVVGEAEPNFTTLNELVAQAYENEYEVCEALQKAVKDTANYVTCNIFFEKLAKTQAKTVIGFGEMLKKLEGITDKFELMKISKQVFKHCP